MSSNAGNTFRKHERLCSRKEIERLFGNGTPLNVFPLKVMFIQRTDLPEIPAKTMFVVPKRNFRKAHDRNRLRRRMREAFRQNKHELYGFLQEKGRPLSIAVLYTAKKETEYAQIEQALKKLLRQIGTL